MFARLRSFTVPTTVAVHCWPAAPLHASVTNSVLPERDTEAIDPVAGDSGEGGGGGGGNATVCGELVWVDEPAWLVAVTAQA